MESSQTLRNTSQISQKHHHYSETFHHHQLQAMKYPSHSSRIRTHSFSSSSSSLSSSGSSLSYNYNPNNTDEYHNTNSPLSTPSSTPFRFSGKPFSWEYFPGIPKKQPSKKKLQDHQSPTIISTNKLLPLPPPSANAITRVKKSTNSSANPSNKRREFFESDPFFAALVECSKDDLRGRRGGHVVDVDDDEESSMSSGEIFCSIASAKVSRSFSDRLGFYASCKRTCAVAESIRRLPRSTGSSNYDLINSRSAR